MIDLEYTGGLDGRGRHERRHDRRPGLLVEVQATAEREPFTRELLDALLDLAGEGIEEITEAQRVALEAAVA